MIEGERGNIEKGEEMQTKKGREIGKNRESQREREKKEEEETVEEDRESEVACVGENERDREKNANEIIVMTATVIFLE